MTSYYRANGQWVMIDTDPSAPTGDAQMNIHLLTNSNFAGQFTQVNFKSFHVTADAIVC
jgi:hypothetical protein